MTTREKTAGAQRTDGSGERSAELDRAVAVTPAEDDPDEVAAPRSSRRFDVELDGGWSVGGGLNGGYLLAILGSAARAALPTKPHPVTLSACFVGPARSGPARVTTRVVREGRGTATLAAELTQRDSPVVTALATTGDLGALPEDVWTTATPPTLPPLVDCPGRESLPEDMRQIAPLQERVDLRLDPACTAWREGRPSGRPELQGWFALPDGREPDPLSLLLTVDALPPVTGELGMLGWAPTVELTAHVRAVPAPGWLRVRHTTGNLAGGFFEEDCEVWDSADRLVAQSRQLAKVPRESG